MELLKEEFENLVHTEDGLLNVTLKPKSQLNIYLIVLIKVLKKQSLLTRQSATNREMATSFGHPDFITTVISTNSDMGVMIAETITIIICFIALYCGYTGVQRIANFSK